MRGQAIIPAKLEFRSIDRLMRLGSAGGASSRCQPLVMHDRGQGLVYHPVPGLTDLEGQVSVFVVSRGKVAVETTALLEEERGAPSRRPPSNNQPRAKLYRGWPGSSNLP